jgi:putative pre-16S rRNA nuclease
VSRILGIDHGSRRIGLAVGDTETGMAFPRPALQRRQLAADLEAIVDLARTEGAARAVLGLPRHMDGSEGSQAAAARAFGERLTASGLDVVFVDERLSSWEATQHLRAIGARTSRRGGEVDSAAARLILQEYLDALGAPPAHQSPTEVE